MKWLVERREDSFEPVTAENMSVLECGALKFYNGVARYPRDILVIAPGQWLTICEADE